MLLTIDAREKEVFTEQFLLRMLLTIDARKTEVFIFLRNDAPDNRCKAKTMKCLRSARSSETVLLTIDGRRKTEVFT